VIVRRGLIECTDERASLIVPDRRVVQPVDPMQRSQHRRHRPLTLRRIGDRDLRDLAGGIVPRDHVIAIASPSIVAAVVRRRETGHDRAPPRRGVRADGLELDRVADRTFASTGNAELQRRRAIDHAEIEASLVELEQRQRIRRAALFVAHPWTRGAQRIAGVLKCVSRCRDQADALRSAEHVGDGLRASRAEIDDAATRRVPQRVIGPFDVDVVLE
jgi:hypothetical protein